MSWIRTIIRAAIRDEWIEVIIYIYIYIYIHIYIYIYIYIYIFIYIYIYISFTCYKSYQTLKNDIHT